MLAHTGRTPGEASAEKVRDQPNRADQEEADRPTIDKCACPTDRNVLEQLMQNVMVALGAWNT